MIERKFIKANLREHEIQEFVESQLSNAGLSDVTYQQTPLGEKIVIYASRPGLVVGRGGSNIAELTEKLKANFDFENPQVEIEEVDEPNLDADIIAERIANNLERFGPTRFKGIGYRALNDAMDAGARGAEITISGRVPSSRARVWRFYAGYLKKCGETSITGVDHGFHLAVIKAGSVGIKVSIMQPDTRLPDDIEVYDATMEDVSSEEKAQEKIEEAKKKAEAKQAGQQEEE
jgi:small subunit ribosomal protein S3